MMVIPLIFSLLDPALLLSHTFLNTNPTSLITNLSHSNSSLTSALQPNEQPSNTAPTIPLMLTTSKMTFLLPLSTQSQLPMHPTLQINFPPPSDPFSTSMPQLKPKQLSKDPTLHGLTPKFSKPSGNAVRLERCWRPLEVLPLTAKKFRAQCNSVRSLISKAKSSFFVQSGNRIIHQSSYTLENPEHNSSSKSLKLISRVPRCVFPCQHIPWLFQR